MPYKRVSVPPRQRVPIVAMLRDDRLNIDPAIDYNKLLVDRRAARRLLKLEEHGHLSRMRSTSAPFAS